MDCSHDRDVPSLNPQAELLMAHLLATGAANTRWDALTATVGFFQGIRAAMRSPEWAQAVIAEDDSRLSPRFAKLFHDKAARVVEALPVTATTEPSEPTS